MQFYTAWSMCFYTISETDCVNSHRLENCAPLVQFSTMPSPDEIFAALEARRMELGLSQAEVCLRAFGKADNSAFQALRRGSSPAVDKMASLCRAVGWELRFGPPADPGPITVLEGSDFAQVPVHKATLAAGGGADNHTEELVGHLAFRRSWLKRVGVAASAAVLARATGESMAPTIHDGDMLLIDRAKADPPAARRSAKDTRPSPIYAILDVDTGARVKRLELAAPGTLALLSDNPSFAPEFRPVDSVKIIGKVVWWGHTSKE